MGCKEHIKRYLYMHNEDGTKINEHKNIVDEIIYKNRKDSDQDFSN